MTDTEEPIAWLPIPAEQVLILDAARVLMDGRSAMAKWIKKYVTPNRDWAKRLLDTWQERETRLARFKKEGKGEK
jgi:hypothetical protein